MSEGHVIPVKSENLVKNIESFRAEIVGTMNQSKVSNPVVETKNRFYL